MAPIGDKIKSTKGPVATQETSADSKKNLKSIGSAVELRLKRDTDLSQHQWKDEEKEISEMMLKTE